MKNHKITLYTLTEYDRGAKIRWILTELGIPFDVKQLNREKKEHESPEFLKLNPMGRVPVVKFDDLVLAESDAICIYLGDALAPGKLSPEFNSPLRGEYLKWVFFAVNTIDSAQRRIMIIEDIPEGEIYRKKLQDLQTEFQDALSTIDLQLKDKEFILGSQPTIADICLSYHLYFCFMWPELSEGATKLSRVTTYLEKMKSLPTAVKANVFSYPV